MENTETLEAQLLATQKDLAHARKELAEMSEWNTIMFELLLRRETQVAGIKEALGTDAAQEHPALAQFRDRMRNSANQ